MSKKFYFLLAVALTLVCLIPETSFARGGGGRGGGGGGGGGRAAGGGARVNGGGNNYSRTPSMSRADIDRGGTRSLPATSQANVPGRVSAGNVNRSVSPNTVNRADFIRQARQDVQHTPVRSAQNQGNAARVNDFRNNYSQIRDTNRNLVNRVNDGIRNNRSDYRGYFGDNFYNRFNYHPGWYGAGAWGAANWASLNGWLGWGWDDPFYYDDEGTYETVPLQYVTEATTSSTPAVQGDWMPLGVFAVAPNEQDAAYTNMFVQMVVDKNGLLSGTYYNAAADKIHPLDGFIDKDTQQAVWRVSDNINSPVMTTGIFNLTQGIADVQVRYSGGRGSEQYWKFVRLEQ